MTKAVAIAMAVAAVIVAALCGSGQPAPSAPDQCEIRVDAPASGREALVVARMGSRGGLCTVIDVTTYRVVP